MSAAKIRAWWFHKQGLDMQVTTTRPADILSGSGWARSVGGSSPYLTFWARGKWRREAVDAAVAGLEIHELPSARGCTYVVPAKHYSLALTLATAFSSSEVNVGRKLGVTDDETERLQAAIKRALKAGVMSPDEIREAVGDATRSLGAEGTKKGMATTLPLALGLLQVAGEIRRVPVNGRLDQQRYRYALWQPNPTAARLPLHEAYIELARLFFKWAGPALASEFQWFSGLGVKAAKAAMEPLGLQTVKGEGAEGGKEARLILPEELDAYEAFQTPSDEQFALVASLDSISALRRDLKSLFEPQDLERRAVGGAGVSELLSNAILDRGRVVGLWEFDPAKPELVYCSFIGTNKAMKQAVRETESYIIEDLGDVRSFSLDSPKSRIPKIELLRKEATAR